MWRDTPGAGRKRCGVRGWAAVLAIGLLIGAPIPGDPAHAQTEMPAPAPREAAAGPETPEQPTLGPVTKLPLPRYVSLRSGKINVRRGPGQIYRIDWVFRRAGLPVRIVDEYGDWRRIVDADDAGGWVYHSLLSGRRTVLVTAPLAELRDEPSVNAPVVARAEQGVVAALLDCEADWCEIEAGEMSGWVEKTAVWGVGADEVLP